MLDNAKKNASKETAAMFVQCILKLTQKKNMKEVDLLWKSICEYFGRKEENPELRQNLQDIANGVGDIEKRLEGDIHDYQNTDLAVTETTIRRKSPFYGHFKAIMERAMHPEDDTDVTNPHYNKTLLEYFLKNYLPLLPLFSCIGTANDELPSNVHVELLFRFYKHHVLQNMQYNTVDRRPSKFFAAIRKMNELKRKEMKGHQKKKKKQTEEEDSWKKNDKKKGKEIKNQNKIKKDSLDLKPGKGAKKRKFSTRQDSCVKGEEDSSQSKEKKIPRNDSTEKSTGKTLQEQIRNLLTPAKQRKKPVRAKKRS